MKPQSAPRATRLWPEVLPMRKQRKRGYRWPLEQVEYILANLTRLTIAQIAKRIGRSPRAVKDWCWYHQQNSRNQDLVTSGVAGRELGLSCQWLTELARAGRFQRARRDPGGRWWLFDLEELQKYPFPRKGGSLWRSETQR